LPTKGKPRRMSSNVDQLVVSNRREHSRKPDEIYGRIESLLEGPYIELFARNQRDQVGIVGVMKVLDLTLSLLYVINMIYSLR
jgi:N6-adenosine-specific RNA methylase IME4